MIRLIMDRQKLIQHKGLRKSVSTFSLPILIEGYYYFFPLKVYIYGVFIYFTSKH